MLQREMRKRAKAFVLVLVLVITLASENVVQASQLPELTVDSVMESVKNYMLSVDTDPGYGSIWNVIGLSRSGLDVPQTYYDAFYNNIVQYMKDKNWVLTKNKYSEYSKIIVALSAIGKDVRDIEGTNMFFYLSDFNNLTKQGFNGPVWALIALKSHPAYTIPVNPDAVKQTTEEGLVTYLLSEEKSQGGWALYGDAADSDITGMTIQALASYYGKRDDVTAAVDRAVIWLSENQTENGGYQTMNTETSESISQVITALSGIGIDGDTDSRFVKNGKSVLESLFGYYLPEGGFMHVAAGAGNNGGGEAGTLNGMATEQGFYACVAYKRMLEKKVFLYDMSDKFSAERWDDTPEQSTQENTSAPEQTETTTESQEMTTQQQEAPKVKIISLTLDYSKINVQEGSSKKLTATVTPSNAANKKLKWKSSDKKIATVNQKGKVTGKKPGTAKITATAKDGSGVKATCTVVVLASQTKTSQTKTTTKKVTLKKPSSNKETTKKEEVEAEQETTKWVFETEEYVPESATEEVGTAPENLQKVPETKIPALGYMGIGAFGCAVVWAIWWMQKRKKLGL